MTVTRKHWNQTQGFTLAELLISLAILGEIATFTIPKILTAQSNTRYNAVTKEVVATISTAYQQYIYQNGASSSITIAALTQYMNYVRVDSTSTVNGTSSTYDCSGIATRQCLVLHSGAYLFYNPNAYFAGTNTTNALWFGIDPSGANDSVSGIGFVLTYTGRTISYGDLNTTYSYNTGTGGGTITGSSNPSWFSW